MESSAPDCGDFGGLHRTKRAPTVDQIVKTAEEDGLDPRMVTRVAFFLLRHPEIAGAFGLWSQE